LEKKVRYDFDYNTIAIPGYHCQEKFSADTILFFFNYLWSMLVYVLMQELISYMSKNLLFLLKI